MRKSSIVPPREDAAAAPYVPQTPAVFHILLALALGGVAAWVDTHNDEVQPAVFCILVFTFLLGITQPRHAWRWALLTGLCIPASGALVRVFGWRTAYPIDDNTVAWSFLALIPATVGAYAGAGARRAAAWLRASPPGPNATESP